jgi:hypothetical protein
MRSLGLVFIVAGLLHSIDAGEPKKRTLADDAASLASMPKHGWVTADKQKVQPWFVEGDSEVRLVLTFKLDADALKTGKATGKVTLGVELSKEGQAEVFFHPAEGTFELTETKEGRFLHIVQKNVPSKAKPFEEKLEMVGFRAAYTLEDGKLSFPKGLETDHWSKWPATVRIKNAIIFQAK